MATRGLVPVRTLNGSEFVTRDYLVNAGTTVFIGNPVEEIAGARVQSASAATSASETLGVIVGLYGRDDDGYPKPLTFSQPTRGPVLTTGASGWAQVCINTDTVYVAEVDATASVGMVGKNILGSAGTPSSAAGISGFILDGSSLAATASLPFKVVGIAPQSIVQDGVNGPFTTNPRLVEVVINQGSLRTKTGI